MAMAKSQDACSWPSKIQSGSMRAIPASSAPNSMAFCVTNSDQRAGVSSRRASATPGKGWSMTAWRRSRAATTSVEFA